MARPQPREVKYLKISSSLQLRDEFEIGRQLGEGAFGSVLLAERKADKRQFAVKKLAKNKDSRSTYGKSWETEIRMMSRYQHEFLVKLEVIYESENNCYLFLEYCDIGTLNDELNRRGSFSELDTRCLLWQLGTAINYLHRHKVVHRDLKLENCLLKRNPGCSCLQHSHKQKHGSSSEGQNHQQQQPPQCPQSLRLTDFGLSIELKDVDHALIDNVGTPVYQAPEIVNGKSYTFKCDVWSFGVMFYWMLHGRPPYQFRNESELHDCIVEFDYASACVDCDLCAGLSSACKRAMTGVLVNSPVNRWSASEFMASPWITEQVQPDGCEETQSSSILDMMRSFNVQQHQK